MFRFVRYSVSHCARAAMTRLEDVNGDVSTWLVVRWLGYLSGFSLLLALSLGLYTRWEKSEETGLPFVLALVVCGAAGGAYCCLGAERAGRALLHLWFGFLFGMQCFVSGPALDNDPKELASNYTLLFGAALRTLWALLGRLFGSTRYRPAVLTAAERLELAGFGVSSAALLLGKSPGVLLLVAALGTVMVALRMKALLALPALICFAAVAADLFLKPWYVPTNPLALGCFFAQLVCDPLLDVYFSGLSVTERWQPFLLSRGLWRRLSLLPVLAVEVVFICLSARRLADMEPLYLTIPAFVIFALIWTSTHLAFVARLWVFHTKLSACQRACLSQCPGVGSLDRIMASRGMRHFCLISKDLALAALVSTSMVAALCWQAYSSIFLSLLVLVLPLECLFHGLFYELGNSLGGTCVGYAVVIPTNYCSPDGQPTLLPPGQVEELNRRSTGILNNVQRFFAHHLIETFGCDYSTSGVTLEALQAKITSFFELRTADGPRHDTYVIFYSGHSLYSGDWALTVISRFLCPTSGGDSLRFDQIVEWWREKNDSFCSRLILVLDCDHSLQWVKEVRSVRGLYVAVQGATLTPVTDVELQDPPQLGDFTAQWVEYNCNSNSNIQWSRRDRAVSADYGISKHWGDYTLHLPSGSDVTNHWGTYFSWMRNTEAESNQSSGCPDLMWLCRVGQRFLKRIKLNWFPPAILDTGQGFKLVRS
ncbi:hypothetical protein L3Q82_023737 [Scortum barcoo]|uniref:Uncharacterized protein n=1 Tax=Scortum barcoo TaxID=214431 RepID=A0ACB8WSU2_9TELE|nr:hypothetical protein L3Q82_023737 [Scortum barcoo]